MPELSVIVPVYKVEKYLSRCIDSILNQSFSDFELILVNDGSPDNCGKICDEYANKDKRIKVIHKENGGLSDARNVGIDIARGEYISFVDSDDWVHCEMFSALIHLIKSESADISICTFKRTTNVTFESHIADKYQVLTPKESIRQMYENNGISFITAWGKIYKTVLFENIRYPKGKIHEDEFTTYKLLYKSTKIVFTESQLYFYYVNLNSIIQSNFTEKNIASLEAIRERVDFFNQKNEDELSEITEFALISAIMYSHQRLCRTKIKKGKRKLKREVLSYLEKSKKYEYINAQKGKQKFWSNLFFLCPDIYSFFRNILKIGI